MTDIRMPALSGRSPLGVLAAMGVLRLLTAAGVDEAADGPRLSWRGDDLTAVLHGELSDVEEVATRLGRIAAGVADGAALPGLPPSFPPPGAAPDKLRVGQGVLAAHARAWATGLGGPADDEVGAWLASLVTDLAADAQHRVAISQFTAPSGKQSMSTMLLKPLELVRAHPDYLHEALVGWRRVEGVTGEYLDHRAMWDATEAGDGRVGNMRGVPGATWLALMAFPLLRTTGIRRRPVSSGWHTVPQGRRRVEELRLPVWSPPLGVDGVTALVEHPLLAPPSLPRPDGTPAGVRRVERARADHEEQLAVLGVLHVCRARRRQPPGSKSAGVLTTVP